jgi:hypothetical protein
MANKVRWNWQAMVERCRSRVKVKKVAVVACMRKMFAMLNAMVRDGTLWGETNRSLASLIQMCGIEQTEPIPTRRLPRTCGTVIQTKESL